jgi:hypothetical protein
MIERYTRKEMAQIWEAENRFRIWLEIETEPAAFFQIILCGNLERGTLAHRALPGQGSATADKRTVSILV